MGKHTKSLFISLGLGSIGLAVALPSCRTSDNKSKEAGLFKSKEEKQIEQDIKSWNDTQEALIEANKRSAKGCEKLDIMWRKIIETQQTEETMQAPNSHFPEVVAFGNGTARRFWRIFEGWSAGEGGSEIRPYEKHSRKYVRLTHRYAALAKFKYVPNKEAVTKLGYTGQYAEGNNCVLGRMSSAVPTGVKDRFTPAVAAKFFTDGAAESQVLIVQHDIGGQSSGTDFTVNPPRAKVIDNNFYTKYLSNRLSFEKGVLSGVGAFSRFFYTAQYFSKNVLNLGYVFDPRELQANHLAERRPNGETVTNAKGPRFVWFAAPSPEWKAEFASMAGKDLDFRKHFLAMNRRIAESQDKPVAFWNVYGSDTWTYEPEKDATLIGQLQADSTVTVSEAADVRLFFKHSIQFRKMPEHENKPSPYTQDFPVAQWNDELFTSECRLGVKESDVFPKSKDDLDGTFIRDAALNPLTLRRAKDGGICLIDIIEDKLDATAGPQLSKYLP